MIAVACWACMAGVHSPDSMTDQPMTAGELVTAPQQPTIRSQAFIRSTSHVAKPRTFYKLALLLCSAAVHHGLQCTLHAVQSKAHLILLHHTCRGLRLPLIVL